jgi:hypothetical protein
MCRIFTEIPQDRTLYKVYTISVNEYFYFISAISWAINDTDRGI